jgi:hypothetical protein
MKYFHGTNAALPTGAILLPGDTIGHSNWPELDNGWGVWMTPHADVAAKYGTHVYEVEPTGDVIDWCDENGWEPTRETAEFIAPAATVLR